ncbi:ABC transporter permease [Streptomyces wuyuanensis]|uniref:FtsX-like permease family protein n=1 Tax=Streptomyces wuyuanensis TaxID=1196353 RepID=A0A1H0DKW1_9ACTN|nr:FtsX-like permease family protein [Streptomyces wuyuanensis]SDN70666.1 FtsX-like permease family protein [Streptomyces wuyuanensis]
MTARIWARDLLMGARFAVGGGREGWTRTLLTGIGVGLGVALLLVTTAIPSALAARDLRGDARSVQTASAGEKAGDDSLLMGEADTRFGGQDIHGRLLMPQGSDAPLPPGLEKFPAPGEMAVSPALDQLLKSDDGTLLRERLDAKVTAIIGDEGLLGPADLAYYEGSNALEQLGGELVTGFGSSAEPVTMDPVLALLIVLVFVALLTPVAVFIAAAVRFGGERRDRRLAALRLVGADGWMTRRIAAGEALAGALAGLVLGAGFFAAARQSASAIELYGSVFPGDLDPSPALAALVALAVPAAAVAVTLLAMRSVVIEPLGVVRAAKPSRRRMWWRLLLPVGGLALLYPMIGMGNENGGFSRGQVSTGVVMLLVGITALLPWLVETVASRLGGGPVSWQLAVRRLQMSSAAAARLVNGIAVAIAGAIALQMMFTGVEGMYSRNTGNDPSRAAISASAGPGDAAAGRAEAIAREIGGTKGVAEATALSETHLARSPKDRTMIANLTMGSCDALREVAHLPSCKDGDTFVLRGGWNDESTAAVAKPGRTVYAVNLGDDSGHRPVAWTLPASAKVATSRSDPTGLERSGILATTKAVPKGLGRGQGADIYIRLDPSVPQAAERARTAVRKADPTLRLMQLQATERSDRFESIRTGLFIGATCVLLLIGVSLLVSQLEQLRERRKLLSALVAFGTRRSTLSMSVLCQTAVPVALALLLSSAVGVALGTVLLKMASVRVTVDWVPVAAMAGVGAGVVLLVTLLSLPPLWRLMRPDGLRTE